MRIAVSVFIGVLVSGCDSLPQAVLVNSTDKTVALRLAESGYWDTAPDEILRIKPGKHKTFVQSLIRHRQLPVLTGGCEYIFLVPWDALDGSMGAMDVVELRDDLRIYQRYALPKKGDRPPEQPPGFPLAFASKVCGR